MERPLCYDVTRLLTRVLNKTPNGIDRIDFSLAQSFLGDAGGARFGAVTMGRLATRAMTGAAAADAVAGIGAHWREAAQGHGPEEAPDPVYRDVVARITGAPRPAHELRRPVSTLKHDVAGAARWIATHGIPLTRKPETTLPKGCVYVNASQFPLWVADAFTWLEARRDVKAAFFIHDLLPLTMPEYFREAEYPRHHKRMAAFARFATAALVTTPTVARDLSEHVAALGRHDLPIFTAATPVASIFTRPRLVDPALAGHPFFLLCSTIEPRKNHLMILAAWRDLVRRRGKAAPKLVLVGSLGWKYELILDLVRRSPALQDHVIHVSGLSTPGLKRLMDNARAVLMPSFGEGYGLPVHEALAAGAPVIASDIPVFRDVAATGLTLLSPLDGEAWLDAVEHLGASERQDTEPTPRASDAADYLASMKAFIEAL